MTMGEKIKKLRESRGLTQKKLGELCGGISDSNIRKYESNKQNPKLETLKKIAEALQVAPADLMGDEYYNKEYPEVFESIGISKTFIDTLSSLGYSIRETEDKEMVEMVLSGISIIINKKDLMDLESNTKDFIKTNMDSLFFTKLTEIRKATRVKRRNQSIKYKSK